MAQVKKHYPIKGRKDFFKFVIIKTGQSLFDPEAEIQKNHEGNEMVFLCKGRAQEVCSAINRVELKRRIRNGKN